MQREQQISEAAEKSFKGLYQPQFRQAFINGAQWADAHPLTDVNDICLSYEQWHKASQKELLAIVEEALRYDVNVNEDIIILFKRIINKKLSEK